MLWCHRVLGFAFLSATVAFAILVAALFGLVSNGIATISLLCAMGVSIASIILFLFLMLSTE